MRNNASRSFFGLNAANFFQAEIVGVVLPVLNAFLKERNWRYDAIGFRDRSRRTWNADLSGAAGWFTDRLTFRRALFGVMTILTGAGFVALPLVPLTHAWVASLLFVSGATKSFFVPLLAALALALVGHDRMNRTMGSNQGWNHAGNISAALLAMAMVLVWGLAWVFYFQGVSSLLAGASVLLIRERDLDQRGTRDDRQHRSDRQALGSDVSPMLAIDGEEAASISAAGRRCAWQADWDRTKACHRRYLLAATAGSLPDAAAITPKEREKASIGSSAHDLRENRIDDRAQRGGPSRIALWTAPAADSRLQDVPGAWPETHIAGTRLGSSEDGERRPLVRHREREVK